MQKIFDPKPIPMLGIATELLGEPPAGFSFVRMRWAIDGNMDGEVCLLPNRDVDKELEKTDKSKHRFKVEKRGAPASYEKPNRMHEGINL